MSGPDLTVGRGVIAEMVRLAAFEVPGVSRVGRGSLMMACVSVYGSLPGPDTPSCPSPDRSAPP